MIDGRMLAYQSSVLPSMWCRQQSSGVLLFLQKIMAFVSYGKLLLDPQLRPTNAGLNNMNRFSYGFAPVYDS